MKSLFGREEIRRLEKAAKDKNKNKLLEWLNSMEIQLDNMLRSEYERAYQDEVQNSVQNALTAVAYALYFSEETYIDKGNLADFMDDLFVTLDMFRTGEYTPKDYEDILAKEEKVFLDSYDGDKIYKEYLKLYDTDLVRYLRNPARYMIAIDGDRKYNKEIIEKYKELSAQGNIVYIPDLHDPNELIKDEPQMLDNMFKDKILLANELYVMNIDNIITENMQKNIDYAKEHNKNIRYLNNINEITK